MMSLTECMMSLTHCIVVNLTNDIANLHVINFLHDVIYILHDVSNQMHDIMNQMHDVINLTHDVIYFMSYACLTLSSNVPPVTVEIKVHNLISHFKSYLEDYCQSTSQTPTKIHRNEY